MWKSSLLPLARRNNYLYLLWMLRVSPRIFEFMLVLDPQAVNSRGPIHDSMSASNTDGV